MRGGLELLGRRFLDLQRLDGIGHAAPPQVPQQKRTERPIIGLTAEPGRLGQTPRQFADMADEGIPGLDLDFANGSHVSG